MVVAVVAAMNRGVPVVLGGSVHLGVAPVVLVAASVPYLGRLLVVLLRPVYRRRLFFIGRLLYASIGTIDEGGLLFAMGTLYGCRLVFAGGQANSCGLVFVQRAVDRCRLVLADGTVNGAGAVFVLRMVD